MTKVYGKFATRSPICFLHVYMYLETPQDVY